MKYDDEYTDYGENIQSQNRQDEEDYSIKDVTITHYDEDEDVTKEQTVHTDTAPHFLTHIDEIIVAATPIVFLAIAASTLVFSVLTNRANSDLVKSFVTGTLSASLTSAGIRSKK